MFKANIQKAKGKDSFSEMALQSGDIKRPAEPTTAPENLPSLPWAVNEKSLCLAQLVEVEA